MATIIREHTKGTGDSTYLLRIKYGCVDAKKALQNYLQYNKPMTQTPKNKGAYVKLFCDNILFFLPKRNAKPLAEWFFDISVSHGYILERPVIRESGDKEYFVNPAILTIKPGPKSKKALCK